MTVTITLSPNGPLVIAADEAARLQLLDHEGNAVSTASGAPVALCRCGGSSTKPFCDGTHARIGFTGAVALNPSQP